MINRITSIGIDNGVTGGIVAINSDGVIIAKHVMPTVKRQFRGKNKSFVDPDKLKDILDLIMTKSGETCICYLEFPTHAQSHDVLRGMTDSFATTRTVINLLWIHCVEVEARQWQKLFWTKPKGLKKGEWDTKEEARKVVYRDWKNQSWLATQRSTKPHSGMIDACLIAQYGRMQNK